MEELLGLKKGAVAHEGDFISKVNEHFTELIGLYCLW
jgi:hypothetical protein